MKQKKYIIFLVLCLAVVALMCGCSKKNTTYQSMEDFKHAKIGVLTGSSFHLLSKEQFPDAEIVYYMDMTDLLLNLEQGKIDGILMDQAWYTSITWEVDGISAIEGNFADMSYGIAFSSDKKSRTLKKQLDAFLQEQNENGEMNKLQAKWFSGTEPEEMPDFSGLKGENGTLRLAVGTQSRPFSYMNGTKIKGYELEFLYQFAEKYGYKLDMEAIAFDAILPSLMTGRYDLAAAGITITKERSESVLFSDITYSDSIVMAVTADNAEGEKTGFFEDIARSFNKTFIREDRWKLMAKGLLVTTIISIGAAIGGSLIGFFLFLLNRSPKRILHTVIQVIGKVYIRIVAGTPVIVILMILFYVIFANMNIDGIPVAIFGFSLTFGAFVYQQLALCTSSIDRGQTEAAYALGYSRSKAFFRIVLPQAMGLFMPSYCGEMVSLVKATAVVGYIAVNDLTKMSDIIRSNTYEAFFPLIATAIIYFLLTWIFSGLLLLVKRHFEPKRRKKETILKGVEVQ